MANKEKQSLMLNLFHSVYSVIFHVSITCILKWPTENISQSFSHFDFVSWHLFRFRFMFFNFFACVVVVSRVLRVHLQLVWYCYFIAPSHFLRFKFTAHDLNIWLISTEWKNTMKKQPPKRKKKNCFQLIHEILVFSW